MKISVRQRLLQLNREFYDTVAEPFNETRRGWTPGKLRLLDYVSTQVSDDRPPADGQASLQIADIGCGNGRFALMLESLGQVINYTGVDGNGRLLALAVAQTADLSYLSTCFVAADLADARWMEQVKLAAGYDMPGFDFIVCLATMQHMPGYDLRRRVLADFASLLAPDGLLAVSAWQFLESERFRKRLVDWPAVGLACDDVEAGDALLPWKQGAYALRYVHQIDENEINRLAWDAGLTIQETYRADGKEGNLNLYAIMRHQEQLKSKL